jgi:hypothetical protein
VGRLFSVVVSFLCGFSAYQLLRNKDRDRDEAGREKRWDGCIDRERKKEIQRRKRRRAREK